MLLAESHAAGGLLETFITASAIVVVCLVCLVLASLLADHDDEELDSGAE
jgi:hypothetical protein